MFRYVHTVMRSSICIVGTLTVKSLTTARLWWNVEDTSDGIAAVTEA